MRQNSIQGSALFLRRPGALGNLGEHGVVGGGVGAEVLLDAHELGRTFAGGGEHESLQAAGHAPVAVAERMDESEIQMRHGRSHRWRRFAVGELRQCLLDQGLHELAVGCLIHDFAAAAAAPTRHPVANGRGAC